MRLSGVVLLLVANTVVVGVAVEGLVRLTGRAPPVDAHYDYFVPDERLPYRPAPNAVFTGRSASDEFDFDLRHNGVGYRDVDRPVKKPGGVFRILGLGDSFTYGAGADYEDTYLRRLERGFSDAGSDPVVEVIKAGIPRFFPAPERLLLEVEGLAYEPDLVIVGFTPNDVVDTWMGVDAITVAPSGHLQRTEARLGKLGMYWYIHSDAFRILQRRLARPPAVEWTEVFLDDGAYEVAWREVERELALMAEVSRAAGAEFAVVHLPMSPFDTAYLGVEDRAYPGRRLARWADHEGVRFIDAFPDVKAAELSGPLYWPRDSHLNARGYEVIADAVSDGIRDLVPAGARSAASR